MMDIKYKKILVAFLLVVIGFCWCYGALAVDAVNPISGLTEAAKDTGMTNTNLPQMVGNVIKALLSMIGVVILLYTIYGGFIWLTSQGDPAKTKKGRDIIINAAIGFIIIMVSYGLATFVVSLFKAQ